MLPKLARPPAAAVVAADGNAAAVICVVPLQRRDLAIGTLSSVQRQAGLDGETTIQSLERGSRRKNPQRPRTRDTLTIELTDRVSSSSAALSDNLILETGVRGKPVVVTLLPITPVLQPALSSPMPTGSCQ